MKNINYTPKPISTDDVKLSDDIIMLSEQIAENVHEVWAASRLAEGWTYGAERNDRLKQHPCLVPYNELPEIEKEDIKAEVYCGKISDDGRVENITIVPMKLVNEEKEYRRYTYTAKISLISGGNYGYTFRVMPTNELLLDSENLDLVKWITK